jgi:DNA polymerase-3 subunit gamma/tau
MTFYLKYRPQKLEELDLEEVRKSLKKIVESGNIPHAFLFAGPKGTGKTSAARILAKIVNCESASKKLRGAKNTEPCNKCKQCTSITKGSNIDVVEIDAASHRGIDDVRLLKDAVKLSSASAKKKVYIIDEAHMLTTEASNALLKTLEEPPEHVLFILATTNPEKLIGTIRSRTTLIRFNKASTDEIVNSLKKIVKEEKLKISDKSLKLIAKSSDSSFRDATKILEQLVSEGVKLEYEQIEEFISKKSPTVINAIFESLHKRKTKKVLSLIEESIDQGVLANDLANSMVETVHESLLAKQGLGDDKLAEFTGEELIQLSELLINALSKIKVSAIEQLPLEVALIQWMEKAGVNIDRGNSKDGTQDGKKASAKEPESSPDETVEGKESSETSEHEQIEANLENIAEDTWARILSEIKPINTSIEALLRAAKPLAYDGKVLKLGVYYRFHKERLEEGRNRHVLEEVVSKVLTAPAKVVCTLTEPSRQPVNKKREKKETVLTETEDEEIIKVAKDIFGS